MPKTKFRIWDKKNKKMIENPTELGLFLSSNGNIVNIKKPDIFLMDRLIVLLSTGCKDKNEKEIFEGDILKTLSKSITNPKPFFYEIILYVGEIDKGERWWYNVGFIAKGFNQDGTTYYRDFPREDWEEIEIIGNIYENPELLKKKVKL